MAYSKSKEYPKRKSPIIIDLDADFCLYTLYNPQEARISQIKITSHAIIPQESAVLNDFRDLAMSPDSSVNASLKIKAIAKPATTAITMMETADKSGWNLLFCIYI